MTLNINASNVSSFIRLFAIILHPIVFGKSTFTYSCACQADVVVSVESRLHSRNCTCYWNLEVYARVPRLESNYVSICKLWPLHFVTCNFWRGNHCGWWKLCRAHFCEVPPKERPSLTTKMAFDRCWRLQYWTLIASQRCSEGWATVDYKKTSFATILEYPLHLSCDHCCGLWADQRLDYVALCHLVVVGTNVLLGIWTLNKNLMIHF